MQKQWGIPHIVGKLYLHIIKEAIQDKYSFKTSRYRDLQSFTNIYHWISDDFKENWLIHQKGVVVNS